MLDACVASRGWLGGCSLYFGDPSPSRQTSAPSAADGGAAIIVDAGPSCPFPGTSATIGYPLDGATDVPQPVPIQNTIYRPLDVDEGLVTGLTDVSGHAVSLDDYDGSCSTPGPPFPTDPETWAECYTNLGSGSAYTWHVEILCYGATADTIVPLATSTFTTAP